MRITFVLPAPIRVPIGGAKVVYQHAAGLAARGHVVRVVAPRRDDAPLSSLKQAAVALRDQWHGVQGQTYYQPPGVQTVEVPDPSPHRFPEADVTIATGFQTAPWVAALPSRCGALAYFVQGKPDYRGAAALETWRLPLAKIAVSRWLARSLEAMGETAHGPILNAVERDLFYQEVPNEERGLTVALLYHRLSVKGPREALDVVARLRSARPDVQVEVFAARPPQHRLPSGVRLSVRPSPDALRALYNRAAVFLSTSQNEGWGLAPMEAAACGCAVVAADNLGVREYLSPQTARLRAPHDTAGLAADVLHLLDRPEARSELARAGCQAVAQFDWDDCTDRLERVLYGLVKKQMRRAEGRRQ